MYFITINLRAQEGGAARGGVSGHAVAATHYYRQTGVGTVTSSWLKILAFTKSKARERREDLVDGHRPQPRHHRIAVYSRRTPLLEAVGPRNHVGRFRRGKEQKFFVRGSW